MNKKYLLIILILGILLFPVTINAEEKYINGHWYLFDENGTIQTGFQDVSIGGGKTKRVYYNEKGWMLYGEQQINGYWYLFNEINGTMQTGFQYIKDQNKTVYYNNEGKMLYGRQVINDKVYYFNKVNGSLQTGIINDSTGIYGYDKNGNPYNGEMNINGHWYLFDATGKAKTGFQDVSIGGEKTKRVYYNEKGWMIYGEQQIEGYWYLFNEINGTMQTGFQYIKDQNKTVYYNNEGKMLYGKQDLANGTYYFNKITGAKETGLIEDNGIYYYGKDGKLDKTAGERNINGHWYLFDETGKAKTGFQDVSIGGGKTKRVYYNEKGWMLYGKQIINNRVYIFDKSNGTLKKGLIYEGNETYYFNDNYEVESGEKEIEGHWYLFDETGKAKTGFQDVSIGGGKTKRVYYNKKGWMLYGEQQIDGYWYLFNTINGTMQTGFQYISNQNKTCYYKESGKDIGRMQYGQQQINGHWYLFDKITGAMLTGFQYIAEQNKTCYYEESGSNIGQMIYGKRTINGMEYEFDSVSGAMKSNFVTDSNGYTYYYYNGTMATGWVTIAGQKYFFNSQGQLIARNAKKVIDISHYQNEKGALNWSSIKNDGVDGVIVKAAGRYWGGGGLYEDAYFYTNVNGAKSQGMIISAYFFSAAINEGEAIQEANMLVSMANAAGGPSTFRYLVYDVEYTSDSYGNVGRHNSISKEMRAKTINKFAEIVRGAGYTPLLYVNKNMLDTGLNINDVQGIDLWYARYNTRSYYNGALVGWQYTSGGTVNGIFGAVDMNVFGTLTYPR